MSTPQHRAAAPRLVRAQRHHVTQLLAIEQLSFTTDRLSRRSFLRFIDQQIGDFYVLQSTDDTVLGYAIVLYRQGTRLARLYSMAVHPDYRRRGYGTQLLHFAEDAAEQHHSLFMRLEVQVDNQAALALYHGHGFADIDMRHEYYDDNSDALILQKLLPSYESGPDVVPHSERMVPYLTQSTDFTCGPASLLMALAHFGKPSLDPHHDELEIWREATTIYMTSGHGGCGPHGLARAALRRGLQVRVQVSEKGPLLLDSVRSEEKKQVMARIQEADIQALQQAKVPIVVGDYDITRLRKDLAAGRLVIALISTYVFDNLRAPHWVLVCAADDEFIYINDPDQDTLPWQSPSERQYLPVPHATFNKAFGFGGRKQKAAVVIGID